MPLIILSLKLVLYKDKVHVSVDKVVVPQHAAKLRPSSLGNEFTLNS